jgi:hypothetical protein
MLSFWAHGGLAFDPVVRALGGAKIWQRSDNSVIVSAAFMTTLRKKDSAQFVAVWPLADSAGRPVGPGTYELVAILKDASGASIIGYAHTRRIRVLQR